MAELLSREEIDALMMTLSETEAESRPGQHPPGRVKAYDFRRPDKLSKDQLRTLHMIHDNFARSVSTSLSAYLRSLVDAEVLSVEQIPYEEYIHTLPNPTVMAVISLGPLEGNAILEMNPDISFTVLERLMGGQGSSVQAARELTDIEQTVIRNVLHRALGNLKEAWDNVMTLEPKLERVEMNPQFTQLVPPHDMVIVVEITLRIKGIEGKMSLCLPYLMLEPIIPKLNAHYWFSTSRRGPSNVQVELLRRRVESMAVPVTVLLGVAQLTIRELLELRMGDVVQLDAPVSEPLHVLIGERRKFLGRPGKQGSKVAVEITELMTEADDSDD